MTQQPTTLTLNVPAWLGGLAKAMIILGLMMIVAGAAVMVSDSTVLGGASTLAAGIVVAGLGLVILNIAPTVDATAGQHRVEYSFLGYGCLMGATGWIFSFSYIGLTFYLAALAFLLAGLVYGLIRRRTLWPVAHTIAAFGIIWMVPYVGYGVRYVVDLF